MLATVSPTSPAIFSINDPEIGLRRIQINVKNQSKFVKITVSKLDKKPSIIRHEVSGKVYKYMEITKENLDEKNISSVKIQFYVKKSWLTENNIDPLKVVLNRYSDNGWEELSTSKIGEELNYLYYEAETPGFSIFAISGNEIKKSSEIVLTTTTSTTTTTAIPSYERKIECGNNICEEGENCGNCLKDCVCPDKYECSDNVCKPIKSQRKIPIRVIVILALIFISIGVIVILIRSLKQDLEKARVKRESEPETPLDELIEEGLL